MRKNDFLTAKQLRWIDEYLVDFNGAAAAVRAGYSARSARSIAHENLTKPDVVAVLRQRQGSMADHLEITRVDVVKGLLEAAAMAKVQCNPAGMVAAWRQVGLLLGLYAPQVQRVELNAGQRGILNDMNTLTDQELYTVIAGGATPLQAPALAQ